MDKRSSKNPYLWLATFNHEDLGIPFRVVKNSEDMIIGGETYHKGWFDVTLPTDRDEIPRGRMVIPNISRGLSNTILGLTTPVRVKLESVLASNTSQVIESWDFFFLRDIQGNRTTITGTLSSWNFVEEPFPARVGTKQRTPGLWL